MQKVDLKKSSETRPTTKGKFFVQYTRLNNPLPNFDILISIDTSTKEKFVCIKQASIKFEYFLTLKFTSNL